MCAYEHDPFKAHLCLGKTCFVLFCFVNMLAQEELTALGGQAITSNVCRSFTSY